MAITFPDFATAALIAPLSVAWNSGSAPPDGDLLIAIAVGSSAGTALAPPSGWTPLYVGTGSTGSSNFSMVGAYWKIAASQATTDSWSTTTTGNSLQVNVLRLAGAVSTAPQFVHTTGTTGAATTGTLTPAALNAVVLAGIAAANGVTGMSTSSSPACTSRVVANFAQNGHGGIIESQNALTSSTSTPTTAISSTISGSFFAWNAFQFVVTPSNPIAVTDTRASFSDSPAIALTHKPSPTDTRAAFSDSPVVKLSRAIAVTDTRAAFSDSPSIVITRPLSTTDTRAAFSDSAALALTHNPNVTDTRAAFSDSPSISITHQIAVTDTRAPFSDSAVVHPQYTYNVNVSDTRNPFSDSPLLILGHNAQFTDTRAAFSDGSVVSLFPVSTQGVAIGNGSSAGAIGNGAYSLGATGNGDIA